MEIVTNKTYFQQRLEEGSAPFVFRNSYIKDDSVINWWHKLAYAQSLLYHVGNDHLKVERLIFYLDTLKAYSRSWVTCAVGNQCAIIPRDEYGCPLDSQLSGLGTQFFENLSETHATAHNLLSLIFERNGYLKNLKIHADMYNKLMVLKCSTDLILERKNVLKHLRKAEEVLHDVEERSKDLILAYKFHKQ